MAWKKLHECPGCGKMHSQNQSLCGTCYTHSRRPELKVHRDLIKASDWLNIKNKITDLNRRGGEKVTATDVRNVVAKSDRHCPYCGTWLEQGNTHIDHIQPIHLGGTNSTANLQLTCNFCNLAKQDRTDTEFRQWLKKIAGRWA